MSQRWPEEDRNRLTRLAYRMVGTMDDAEDIVQDAYLRWERADTSAIEKPSAWLAKTVSRLSLDFMRSARKRREIYIGPWLPQPVVETGFEPDDPVEREEDISYALMLVLEELTPKERAAFLLREVFDFDYADLAEALGETQANCRQLVSRARKRLEADRDILATPPRTEQKTLIAFARAVRAADASRLLDLLREDAVLMGDGGGKALTARNPIYGADRISRFYLGVVKKIESDRTFTLANVNGHPGIVSRTNGTIDMVLSLVVGHDGRITRILHMNNPDKLMRLNAQPRNRKTI